MEAKHVGLYSPMNTFKQSLYFIGNMALLITLAVHISAHLTQKPDTHLTQKDNCIHTNSLHVFHQWLSRAPHGIQLQNIHLEASKAIVQYLSPENIALAWVLPWESSHSLLSLQQHSTSPHQLAIQATLRLKSSGDTP